MSSFAKTHLRCMHAVRAALHVSLHDMLPAVPLSHYRRGRLACKSIRLSVMKRALCSQRLGRLQSTSTSSSGLYRVHIQAFSSKVSANVRTGDKRLVVAIGWLGSKQKHFDKLAPSTSCLPAPATAIACSRHLQRSPAMQVPGTVAKYGACSGGDPAQHAVHRPASPRRQSGSQLPAAGQRSAAAAPRAARAVPHLQVAHPAASGGAALVPQRWLSSLGFDTRIHY